MVIPPEQDEENSPITNGLFKPYVEANTYVGMTFVTEIILTYLNLNLIHTLNGADALKVA